MQQGHQRTVHNWDHETNEKDHPYRCLYSPTGQHPQQENPGADAKQPQHQTVNLLFKTAPHADQQAAHQDPYPCSRLNRTVFTSAALKMILTSSGIKEKAGVSAILKIIARAMIAIIPFQPRK